MYFPDRGCVHTLLTLFVYATDSVGSHTEALQPRDGSSMTVGRHADDQELLGSQHAEVHSEVSVYS